MSWKDYFYFTRTERNGIFVLIFLIIIILLYPLVYDRFSTSAPYDFSLFEKNVEQHLDLLNDYRQAQLEMEKNKQKQTFDDAQISLNPALFNPNELSREEFTAMNIPDRIINNIINYRNAGGEFRYREDFKRIYTISEDLYNQMAAYIDLPPKPVRKPASNLSDTALTPDSVKRKRYTPAWADIVIDINAADTTQWQQIRGIGPVFSRRITSYRELLGGFYSIDQLREVYGMDSTRFDQISSHIKADSINLRKININTADFVTLVRHPYLNRNQVNSILRMRERHGLYQSIDEIKKSDLIDADNFIKIAPYLTVSE